MLPELREDRPAYVRFEKQPVEDRTATIATGSYQTRDVDFAIITPPGSRDEIPMTAERWLDDLTQQVRQERIPVKWADQYRELYERWKKGEELPLNGTPIKSWSVLSPSQRQAIISANILTVEDLAKANGEALGRIGMGAVALKQRAETWLKAATSIGPVVQENEALRVRVKTLEVEVEGLQAKIAELKAKVKEAA